MIGLDCIETVVDEAIALKCNVIISHHPIVFTGLKTLTGKTYIERVIVKAIKKKPQEVFFWKTHSGAELDLFWQDKGKNWGIEFKYGDAPSATKSMHISISDLSLEHLWVLYPGKENYKLTPKITVSSLMGFLGSYG